MKGQKRKKGEEGKREKGEERVMFEDQCKPGD